MAFKVPVVSSLLPNHLICSERIRQVDTLIVGDFQKTNTWKSYLILQEMLYRNNEWEETTTVNMTKYSTLPQPEISGLT